MRAFTPLHPDPIRIGQLAPRQRWQVGVGGAGLAVALGLALLPGSWLEVSGVVTLDAAAFGPMIGGAVAAILLAAATRLLWEATEATAGRRPLAAVMGLIVGALSGTGARAFLELAVLREGWRPGSVFGEPWRALPVLWMWLAGLTHLGGFMLGITVVFVAVVPHRLLTRSGFRPDRAVSRLGGLLSWFPFLHVVLIVVGVLAIGPALLDALGVIDPTAGGSVTSIGPEWVFFGSWSGLLSISVIQLLVGFWGAVELARLVDSTLPDRFGPSRRASALEWSSIGMAIVAAVVLGRQRLWGRLELTEAAAVRFIGVLDNSHIVRSVPVLAVGALGLAVPLVALALLLGDEEGDDGSILAVVIGFLPGRRAPRPEAVLVVSLGAVLLFDVVIRFLAVWTRAIAQPLQFLADRTSYIDFWATVELVPDYPMVDAAHILGPALGVVFVLAIFLVPFEPTRVAGIGALAMTFGMMFLAPTIEETSTILLLYGAFAVGVLAVLGLLQRPYGSVVVARVAGVTALVLIFGWLPDAPAALSLAGAVGLRLLWQAGVLNHADPGQSRRVALTMGFALFLGGLTVAQATSSVLEGPGTAFASVGQSIALPFIGIPLAAALCSWRLSSLANSSTR